MSANEGGDVDDAIFALPFLRTLGSKIRFQVKAVKMLNN